MEKMVTGLGVKKQLRMMEVGQELVFSPETNENTLRNACNVLKRQGEGLWSVAKQSDHQGVRGFNVKRISNTVEV